MSGPPWIELSLLAVGPFPFLAGRRSGMAVLLLLASLALFRGEPLGGLGHALLIPFLTGSLLHRPGTGGRWRLAVLCAWTALFLLPWWLPGLSRDLLGGEGPPLGWTWGWWPGAGLAGSGWDPSLSPPLYGNWASATPLSGVSTVLYDLLYASSAALLYFGRRGSPQDPRK